MNRTLNKIKHKDYGAKTLVAVCAVITVLLVLSLFFKQILLLCFLFLLIVLIWTSSGFSSAVIFYLLPLAIVLRYNPSTMSLFTPLCVAEAIIILVRRKRIDAVFFLLIYILTGYVVLTCNGNYTDAMKLSTAILLFGLLDFECVEKNKQLNGISFSFGVLVSSFIALWQNRIPRLLAMYAEIDYVYLRSGRIRRFSGIFQDPNYYAVAIIMAIAFIECQKKSASRRSSRLMLIMQCVMLIFGGLTYSKSFFLMFIFLCIYLSLRYRSGKRIFVWLLLACTAVLVIVLNPFEIVSTVVERLLSEDLTTGRTKQWKLYCAALSDNYISLFFGHGLKARLKNAAHNTWLQMLYQLGIVGSTILLLAISRIIHINKTVLKRNSANYSGFLILIVMFSFLDGLTSYELPFYLSMANTIYNTNLSTEGISNETDVN